MEHNLLCRTSGHKCHQTGFQLFFRHQVFFFFRHLHHIAQRSHRTRYNRNLLHRLRIFLQRRCQRMAHFMISDNPLFFLAKYPVFLFLARNHDLHRFKQIRLIDILPAVFHRIDRSFIDHIRKVRPNRPGSRKRNRIQIHRFIHQHIFGVDF